MSERVTYACCNCYLDDVYASEMFDVYFEMISYVGRVCWTPRSAVMLGTAGCSGELISISFPFEAVLRTSV